MTTFNPDKWLTSLHRALRSYVEDSLDLDGVYELSMSYPTAEMISQKVPLPLTIIHFDIDNISLVPFGFGDNVVDGTYNEVGQTVEEWEAHCHEVEMNVGIWASVESGGVSARLEAREDLDRLFVGPAARAACLSQTGGVEILSFMGGTFVNDLVNDIPIFRVVDATLRLRVFSRTRLGDTPFISDVIQEPGIVIEDQVIIG